MKQIFIPGLLILFMTGACSLEDKEYQILSGTFSEVSPVEGRTRLTFLPGKRVVKTEVEDENSDTFSYEIVGNRIKLTPVWDTSHTSELFIEIINETEFKIENLYVSIPEDPPVTMGFKK